MDDETSSVDAILKTLTKRPNVRSTLILSRKNGSIIKASGLIADETNGGANLQTSYGANDQSTSGAQVSADDTDPADGDTEASTQEPRLSRAQILAGSIFAFVAAAVDLGGSLQNLVDQGESLPGTEGTTKESSQDNSNPTQPKLDTQSEDDVQLLRLRLKKQEIIIFPDPNYLCCVVQDLERNVR